MRIGLLSLLLTAPLIAAGPASAQTRPPPPPRDAIGDLLDPHHVAAPGDEDEPDTAGQVRTAPEPEPVAPTGPTYRAGPRPRLNAPVHIEETGKTADAPPSVAAMAYDSRIRSSFVSAESFQGPLDGGWTLAEALGGDHFVLQIVDRRDRLEAVWRDVRRTGALNASGMVDEIRRTDDGLTLRFTDASAQAAVVNLRQAGAGRWAGRMTRGADVYAVTLRRTGP